MRDFSGFLLGNAAASAVIGAALLSLTCAVQARDNVYWSVGIEAAPGVSVGLSNTRPVVIAPQPVYVMPPVVLGPQTIYAPAPAYVQPAPVYVQPRSVYAVPLVQYVQTPVYVRPAPAYHGQGYFGPPGHSKHWKKHRHHRQAWKH